MFFYPPLYPAYGPINNLALANAYNTSLTYMNDKINYFYPYHHGHYHHHHHHGHYGHYHHDYHGHHYWRDNYRHGPHRRYRC